MPPRSARPARQSTASAQGTPVPRGPPETLSTSKWRRSATRVEPVLHLSSCSGIVPRAESLKRVLLAAADCPRFQQFPDRFDQRAPVRAQLHYPLGNYFFQQFL